MLAKEIKIKTLKQQREFILKELTHLPECRKDGNCLYRYVGYIYPEVIEYFRNEGFTVTEIKSDFITALSEGSPVYIFTVSDDIKLSEKEMEQAEEYNYSRDDNFPSNFSDFMSDLLMELNDRG